MTPRTPLSVWLYGTRLATLTGGRDDGFEMSWTQDSYDRWGAGSRVMSNLLPITRPAVRPNPRRVRAFIEGLLPEGNARSHYAIDVGLRSDDIYGLISRYGRDTAGALVFQQVDEPSPDRVGRYVPLTDDEVGQRLRDADRHSTADQSTRGVESISLAGMQPKIGLHRTTSGWQACRAGAPSTWIVKLAHPVDSVAADVIDTEVLALDLARTIGLTSVTAQIHEFGGVRAIAVSRYDRVESAPGPVARVHQEDFAQALGLNTDDPLRKFQRGNRIPSLTAAAEVLGNSGSGPEGLIRLVAFNYLIGNTDAHAKNISFIRSPDGTAVLAPAYDVAMHLHHNRRDPLSAMDINGKFHMDEITIHDVIAQAQMCGLRAPAARDVVSGVAETLRDALGQVERDTYPGVSVAALELVGRRVDTALSDLARPRVGLGGGAPTPGAAGGPAGPVDAHSRAGRPTAPYTRRAPRRRR